MTGHAFKNVPSRLSHIFVQYKYILSVVTVFRYSIVTIRALFTCIYYSCYILVYKYVYFCSNIKIYLYILSV